MWRVHNRLLLIPPSCSSVLHPSPPLSLSTLLPPCHAQKDPYYDKFSQEQPAGDHSVVDDSHWTNKVSLLVKRLSAPIFLVKLLLEEAPNISSSPPSLQQQPQTPQTPPPSDCWNQFWCHQDTVPTAQRPPSRSSSDFYCGAESPGRKAEAMNDSHADGLRTSRTTLPSLPGYSGDANQLRRTGTWDTWAARRQQQQWLACAAG